MDKEELVQVIENKIEMINFKKKVKKDYFNESKELALLLIKYFNNKTMNRFNEIRLLKKIVGLINESKNLKISYDYFNSLNNLDKEEKVFNGIENESGKSIKQIFLGKFCVDQEISEHLVALGNLSNSKYAKCIMCDNELFYNDNNYIFKDKIEIDSNNILVLNTKKYYYINSEGNIIKIIKQVIPLNNTQGKVITYFRDYNEAEELEYKYYEYNDVNFEKRRGIALFTNNPLRRFNDEEFYMIYGRHRKLTEKAYELIRSFKSR